MGDAPQVGLWEVADQYESQSPQVIDRSLRFLGLDFPEG